MNSNEIKAISNKLTLKPSIILSIFDYSLIDLCFIDIFLLILIG